jgi:hypothetical protein
MVWADSETGQNSPFRPDLHVNFSLARSGEAIGLFTPDGIQIDAVTFGAQITDVSRGRFPDASSSIYFLTNYTPGAANFLSQINLAPVLDPIGDTTIFEGQPLTFTPAVTDGNIPGQQLTWSLLNAPPGAIIHPTSGLFGWQAPELESGSGSNFNVTVRVTDNGIPPLSDTNSFAVMVLKTNNRPSLVTSGNQTVNEGSLLTFAVSATDADLPPQNVTFSLDPQGLPAGAAINPTNGIFTWEPVESQGPAVYGITIRATDDGTPPLSDFALITIVVNESNTPPTLTSITNRALALGEAISFTAQAADFDLPEQVLSFDFVGDVPSGATLNATNGLFSWTANMVGTNTFTVRATDSGAPALSDVKTFDIVVTASFQITRISLSNEVVTLTWNAMSGRSYAVEYKNSLADAAWLPLTTNILAASTSASATDSVGTNTQRLYRIVLEP